MRSLTRVSTLLVALCLSALSAPASHANAADPAVFVCTQAHPVIDPIDSLKKYCDFYDPTYELVVYDFCIDTVRGIPSPSNINDNEYVFTGARAGGNWVAATQTVCWIGDAVGQEAHTGQYGVMVGQVATGPMSQQNDSLCTQWFVQFKPGNPFGRDSSTFYGTPVYCGPPPLVSI